MRKSIHFAVIILTVGLVLGLASRAPGSVSDRFDQAKSYREDKQYDQAEQVYRQIVAQFPDSNDALEAQKQLTCLYIITDEQAQADTAFAELTAAFSGHKDIAQAVHDIAYHYRTINRQEKANEIDQYVLSAWPETDVALLGQMDIAKYYVDQGNDPKAQPAIDKLLRDFSGNPLIARAVHDIAQHYRWSGKYEKANRLYQYVVTNWPNAEHALWARADLIKSYLALGDDPNAEAAVEGLLANFTDNPLIARAIHDTAYEYRKLEKYDRADQLDQFVIENWPEDEQAMWAKMDMAKTNILLENDALVEATIDTLIAECSDNAHLSRVIFTFGEEYYNKAYAMENEGLSGEAKNYFSKAIAIFEKVITELPPHETYTGYAQHLLNDCYRRFGDKYCGAYVVWHTLNYYGLTKPIDLIVKEMQLDKKDSVSIYELVAALKGNRISTRAVKFDLGKITKIDKPFIQYISPTNAGEFGHFVLCIPTGSGKAVTLDGAEEPKVIDLTFSEEDTYQQRRWDGTSILIYGIETQIEDDPVSGFLDLDVLLQLAADWLERENGETPLSLDLQAALYGGCPDDCKSTGKKCFNAPYCDSDADCDEFLEDYACYDSTGKVDELCQKPGSSPDCVYDSAHKCNPRRKVGGLCYLSKNYCKPRTIDFGDCKLGDEHPPDRAWLRQCHN